MRPVFTTGAYTAAMLLLVVPLFTLEAAAVAEAAAVLADTAALRDAVGE